MKNYRRNIRKILLAIFLLDLLAINAQEVNIEFDQETFQYKERKFSMDIVRPIITLPNNPTASNRINDSIVKYINHWKTDIPKHLDFLFKDGGGILKDRAYFAATIEPDTITTFNNVVHVLFNCMTDNISGNKYYYWYDLLSFSMKDGSFVHSKVKDHFETQGKIISLHELVEKRIPEEVCKPRFLFVMDDIVPLSNKQYYIPFTVEFSMEKESCREIETLMKINVSKTEIENVVANRLSTLRKVIVKKASVYKEPDKPSNRFLEIGHDVFVIDNSGEYCKIDYFFEETISKTAWIKKSDISEKEITKILIIKSNKAAIYSSPNVISKSYLLKGDKVELLVEDKGYFKIKYRGKRDFVGWIKKEEAE